MSKPTRKAHRSKRTKRYYGMTVLEGGTNKYAFLSVQNKHGWSLGLALNNRTVWLRNIRFKTRKDVEAVAGRGRVVFIALKGSK